MAAKVKCPDCGAKNPVGQRRCRLCTKIINHDTPEAASAESTAANPEVDVFNANEISRQTQSPRAAFGGTSGLGSRLAAAGGLPDATPPPVESPIVVPLEQTPLDPAEPFNPSDLISDLPAEPPPPPPPAPEPEKFERFDPDALFRDS